MRSSAWGLVEALAVLDLGKLAPRDNNADPDALCLRAEVLAGQRLDEGGGTVKLSADEWLDRLRAFLQQSLATDIAESRLEQRARVLRNSRRCLDRYFLERPSRVEYDASRNHPDEAIQ
jgi:hypothetical protein